MLTPSHDKVHHMTPVVSWWFERQADGWHWVVAGSNWIKRSANGFRSQYACQRDALSIFSEAPL